MMTTAARPTNPRLPYRLERADGTVKTSASLDAVLRAWRPGDVVLGWFADRPWSDDARPHPREAPHWHIYTSAGWF